MPGTLQSLKAKERHLAVEYEGDPEFVTVTFNPKSLNARLEEEVHELAISAESGRPALATVKIVLWMVTAWDFRAEEKGPVVALTEEALKDVPTDFLSAIVNTIQEDQNPKEPTEPPSS